MEVFKHVQKATQVPLQNVLGYGVESLGYGKVILIHLPEGGWIRIDLKDKTFSVGASEG